MTPVPPSKSYARRRLTVSVAAIVALLSTSGAYAAADRDPAPVEPSAGREDFEPRAAVPGGGARVDASVDALAPEGWQLDRHESFETLDRGLWNVRDRTYNSNEDSYLLAENTTIEDGKLRIQATNRDFGGRSYTSGYVDTNGTYALPNYFRVRIRAKVPMEQGMWAAPLWFRPVDRSGGEIDLIETYGRERGRPLVHQTIHTDYGAWHQQSARPTPFAVVGDLTGTEWHTYVVEKTPGLIQMWTDGVPTATWRSGDPDWFDRYYEAGKRWNLRVNLQVGGDWGGLPDATTDWSGDLTAMQVDYIRTWIPEQADRGSASR